MHEFSPRRQKHQPTRIFLANAFLSNISLDGTHRDTKYRALLDLYKKDEPQESLSSKELVSAVPREGASLESHPNKHGALQHSTSMAPYISKQREKGKALGRSNSMRSKQSRWSMSSSSSSQSSSESAKSSDDEARDREFPLKEFKPRKILDKVGVRNVRGIQDEEQVLAMARAKRTRKEQRRSSSGSQPHSNKGKMDVLMQRQRASRTVSAGSSDPPMARLRHGSGSTSPGRASGGQFSSCSQPNFGSRDSIPEQVGSGSIEISLADLFAQPGEILDSHKGVVTERKDFTFTANDYNLWPVSLLSFVSKYRLEQVEEERVEQHQSTGHTVTFSVQPQSLLQRIFSRFTRNDSMNSVTTGRNSAPSPDHSSRTTPLLRRPWQWPLKSRITQPHIHVHSVRPRRLSAASSIHIDTEAEALENLLGIRLTADPDDELSYENLLVPLAWTVDYIGDLTPDEAKSLLNTGEIAQTNKLIPAHPNSFDENYAYAKLFRRDFSEFRPKYSAISSQESNRSSQEPARAGPQFANDGYKPGILEDPEWETAVKRQNLYLESYFSSIISNDLDPDKKKEALNELFRSKFPHIQLSFSKFKSIKRDMQKASTDHQVRLDLAVVALSYVYFEKLVLKGFINKPNRKILASVCIVLAAKMNDLTKEEHGELLHSIQSQLRVERDELKAFEFAVMVALGFDLHVPMRYVRYHYNLLAKSNEALPSVYLIPLPEPCPRERLSLTMKPIRQISFPGFSSLATTHRVNSRPANRRK